MIYLQLIVLRPWNFLVILENPINIKLLEDHPIPKLLSFFSCPQHNIKTPKTCYSSQSETGGERGEGGVS